uniref:Oligopeptide transporter 1 n=1 Tax=Cacopsylla melanoneura TaxID=428564 RepID=A0A8D8V3U9_9HEMI
MKMENKTDNLEIEDKIKYPKSVFFIITNEFCERFCYYGMKTVLYLYLIKKLNYEEQGATVLYHSWAGLCYFFPIFGGILADTFLGKFSTIVYLSLIYFLGNVLLSVTSITNLHLPQVELSLVGLLLIAIGTGGIKPCVSSFGGDQFILPQQQDQLDKFFSFFYFAINAGSLISTFITPIFREDLKCFGEDSCFPVAFGVPAALMLVSIVVFIVGRPLYKINKPKGNIVVSVCKCICHALKNKSKLSKSNQTKNHWLDYADDRYSDKIIGDIKILLRVLVLFVPLPVFWALFDQQGSKWTSQANRMSGDFIGTSFTIIPDQMQVINPFLILAMIPLFQYFVYPIIARCGISTPLRKLATGGLLAAVAFVVSALVEFEIRGTDKIVTLRVYNQLDCGFTFNSPALNGTITPMGFIAFNKVRGSQEMPIEFVPDTDCKTVKTPFSTKVTRVETKGTAYLLNNNTLGVGTLTRIGDFDDINTSSAEPTKLRFLYNSEMQGKKITLESNLGYRQTIQLPTDKLYTDYIAGQPTGLYKFIYDDNVILGQDVPQKRGGVFVFNIHCAGQKCESQILEAAHGWVHMLWLLPQYIIITAAEIMFSITGFEFAFTQAPVSMKSVLSACWLLTVAFGNLIVVLVAEAKFFENQAYEFLLFAGLMALDMLVFIILAISYQYVTHHDTEEEEDDDKMPHQSTNTLGSTVTNND